MIRKNPLTRKVLQVSPADLIYFEICYSRPKTKATRIFLCAQKAILEVKIPSENGGGGGWTRLIAWAPLILLCSTPSFIFIITQSKVDVIMHFFEKLRLQGETNPKPIVHLLFIDVCSLLM